MSNNMQATAARVLVASEARQLERTWRSWARSAISCARKRQAERGESGVAVTMTSDGLMAKLRAASFRSVLSGAEFHNDGGGRFGAETGGHRVVHASLRAKLVPCIERRALCLREVRLVRLR